MNNNVTVPFAVPFDHTVLVTLMSEINIVSWSSVIHILTNFEPRQNNLVHFRVSPNRVARMNLPEVDPSKRRAAWLEIAPQVRIGSSSSRLRSLLRRLGLGLVVSVFRVVRVFFFFFPFVAFVLCGWVSVVVHDKVGSCRRWADELPEGRESFCIDAFQSPTVAVGDPARFDFALTLTMGAQLGMYTNRTKGHQDQAATARI